VLHHVFVALLLRVLNHAAENLLLSFSNFQSRYKFTHFGSVFTENEVLCRINYVLGLI
jgi:hypothetical protein